MHENDIAAHCATRDISKIRDLLGRIPLIDGGGGDVNSQGSGTMGGDNNMMEV